MKNVLVHHSARRALKRTRPGPAHADHWLRDPRSLNGRTPPVPSRHRLRERVRDPQNDGAGGASPGARAPQAAVRLPHPRPSATEPPARSPLPDPQARQESEVPQLPKGTFLKPFKRHFPPRQLRPARLAGGCSVLSAEGRPGKAGGEPGGKALSRDFWAPFLSTSYTPSPSPAWGACRRRGGVAASLMVRTPHPGCHGDG